MIIVARLTANGKEYIGKRDVTMYEGNTIQVKDANVGLTLRNQREIRDALKVKNGIKVAKSGGIAVDYSDIPEL